MNGDISSTAEIFNGGLKGFEPTLISVQGHEATFACATLIGDDTALLSGGYDGGNNLKTVTMYDLKTGEWTAKPGIV